MIFSRSASALALCLVFSGTTAGAYTLDQAARPAEYPPASYNSDVYIDSRGCAYVRANIGTAVNWVPRLSRDRKTVVCGMHPTNVAAAATPPPPPPPPPAPKEDGSPSQVVPVAAPATVRAAAAPVPAAPAAPATTAAAPATVKRTMTVTCPADGSTARVRIGRDTLSVNCAPNQRTTQSYIVRHANGDRTRLVIRASEPVLVAEPVVRAPVATRPAATSGTVASNGRVRIGGVAPGTATNNFGSGYGVGGGAAPVDPVPGLTAGRPVLRSLGLPAVPSVTAPAPRAPAAQPRQRVIIPSGYRSAWDDNRLNPNRGPRTARGDAQMAALYDVTKVPMADANPEKPNGLIVQPEAGLLVSSKSSQPAGVQAAPAAPTGRRYVQVGMFNVMSNAEAAAAKLRAIGLPGRIAKTRSGKTVVIAGPYASAADLRAALAKARNGGFSDAFTRS